MLVLTRKIGEAIVIDGGIVVRVLDASAGRVRLGIAAPNEMLVLREEIATRLNITPTRVESESVRTRVTRT